MSDRTTWLTTTHDWSSDLDLGHLAEVRAGADFYGTGGRRHLILEVLAYANDEAESLGRVGVALVGLEPHGSVRVSDDGRGTDTRVDADGRMVRKPVMATKDVRFFGAIDGPLLPDGLPRHGMSIVAALSSVLIHENRRVNGAWAQTYRYGVPDGELAAHHAEGASGTSVTFTPDARITGRADLADEDLTAFPWLRVELVRQA